MQLYSQHLLRMNEQSITEDFNIRDTHNRLPYTRRHKQGGRERGREGGREKEKQQRRQIKDKWRHKMNNRKRKNLYSLAELTGYGVVYCKT